MAVASQGCVRSPHWLNSYGWSAGSAQQIAGFAAQHIGWWPWSLLAGHAWWGDWHGDIDLPCVVRQVERKRQRWPAGFGSRAICACEQQRGDQQWMHVHSIGCVG